MTTQSSTPIWVGLLIVNSLLLLLVGYWGFQTQSMTQLTADAANRLTLFASSLEGKLAKYEYLPELLSRDPHLTTALRDRNPVQIQATNIFLENVAKTAGVSDAYLMNRNGTTIAASNWKLSLSFIGRNFGFRPYFKQAISGETGRYFALGTTSKQRGYYYAYPVRSRKKVVGAIVIKINLSDIEKAWTERGTEFIVTDSDGIVFLTTRPDWRYVSIKPLDPKTLERIRLSRRYTAESIDSLRITHIDRIDKSTERVLIGATNGPLVESFVMRTINMPSAGWNVHILSDTRVVQTGVLMKTALAGFAILVLVLVISLYFVNRQRQKALAIARDRLEERVQLRTVELRCEVDERRKAEQNLRETQRELIHAAKMAGLGQMSAGIAHELNQPLTAIRAFADNAQRMLKLQKFEPLEGNLQQITELTEKTAGIISQLRGFSRKSQGERKSVSVNNAIEQAFGLFRREIDRNQIVVDKNVDPDLVVETDPQLLNQVLVNLVSNAVDAVSDGEDRRIRVSCERMRGQCRISIADNGPGIPAEVVDNIFDPFFTTKEVGLGLGLGLSISYRIMETLNGSIRACNIENGGACFTICL